MKILSEEEDALVLMREGDVSVEKRRDVNK